MESRQDSISNHQNINMALNGSVYLKPRTELAFSNISFGLGCCITFINITALYILVRHKKYVSENGFLQQLIFLCSTDILSGIAVAVTPLGHFFISFHVDIYYFFCVLGHCLYPISLTLSVGNCFVISIHRFIIISKTDSPLTSSHRRITYLMILSNVLFCITTFCVSVIVVIANFGFQYVEFCDKVNLPGQNEYKTKYIVGFMIIFSAFLLGTNVVTVLSIVVIKRQGELQFNGTFPAGSSTSATFILGIMKRNRYATVTFILIVLVLNLTIVPSLMFMFVSTQKKVQVSADTTEIISRLMCVNSLLNPFVYLARTTDIRMAVWNDIKEIVSRIRCACTSHSLQD